MRHVSSVMPIMLRPTKECVLAWEALGTARWAPRAHALRYARERRAAAVHATSFNRKLNYKSWETPNKRSAQRWVMTQPTQRKPGGITHTPSERARYVPPVKKRPMKSNNLMNAQHRILVSSVACTLTALASVATPGVDDPEAAPPAPAPAPATSTLDTTVGGMN